MNLLFELYKENWNAFTMNPPSKDAPLGAILLFGVTTFLLGAGVLGLIAAVISWAF